MHAPQLVVGTAGHIDHGKSRLVWKLTGTDPDRLPEEKARGMTIDLGFAHARIDGCDIHFVDVPGHERFIRNMVAGAAGVDLALLVVAADDAVMPQTREHIELLALLGFRSCLIVLTKMDLVEDDWADAVEDEVRTALLRAEIEAIRCVRTSAATGRGFDELSQALAGLARRKAETANAVAAPAWFRIAIDRAFTVAGRGTVVTGTVMHGRTARDEELELWPAGARVRVRDLQSHNEAMPDADGRMRLAINLAGIPLEAVRRGCELATPGHLEPTHCLTAQLMTIRMPGQAERDRFRVRLHMATAECEASLRLHRDAAGGVWGQLRTAEPLVASWGQRLVLRDETGARTLGGGRVIAPVARPWTARHPPDEVRLRALASDDAQQRIDAAIREYEWNACSIAQLSTRAGVFDAATVASIIERLARERRAVWIGDAHAQALLHLDLLSATATALVDKLNAHLAANPRLAGVPRSEWPGWMPRACPEQLRPALAEWMISSGRVVLSGQHVLPKGHAAAMSAADQSLFDGILRAFFDAAFQPPELGQLPGVDARNAKRARELIERAVARGMLVRIADGMWLHGERHAELLSVISREFAARPELTIADLRSLLNTTRKYMVPLAEFLDAAGFTKRAGDVRRAGSKLPAAAAGPRAGT